LFPRYQRSEQALVLGQAVWRSQRAHDCLRCVPTQREPPRRNPQLSQLELRQESSRRSRRC
jgi:hypothetical protein